MIDRQLRRPALIASCLLVLHAVAPVRGEMLSLEVYQREPFAGGAAFGESGPYEKIVGVARFAVDPNHPRNLGIIDLALAPRNSKGLVEFEADVFLLAPRDR